MVPGCDYPAETGMKVETHPESAVRARKTIVEVYLSPRISRIWMIASIALEMAIASYKGIITVHSEPDEGSTFSVTLPGLRLASAPE